MSTGHSSGFPYTQGRPRATARSGSPAPLTDRKRRQEKFHKGLPFYVRWILLVAGSAGRLCRMGGESHCPNPEPRRKGAR